MMSSKKDGHCGAKDKKDQRIQVFARTRPLNSSEITHCSHGILEVCTEKKEIRVKYGKTVNRTFAFDGVFGPNTEQIQVYKAVVEPLIQEVLMGYNCTVFAYGQTSTGKTFTMEGERTPNEYEWDKDPKAGIIPRSLHQLFEELHKEENVEFSVHVSFLELYNEELFDLLSPNDVQISKLRLFEDPSRKGSVVIQGLEEIKVNTKDEVYSILERGTMRRQTAATLLNAQSSRSHTVFSVTVHIKENTIDGEELLKTGKLNLVDLAGSENISRSGAESSQKATREAGNINQSLLTLGRVITALVDKAPHVPYRESKLTRLLQDSLGGHTKTSIIATVSPALNKSEETVRTLDYAQRAKNITIQPEVNQKTTKRALIKEYTEEIERLRKDLMASRDKNGVFLHPENYLALQNNIEAKERLIEELNNKIGIMTTEFEKYNERLTSLEEELISTKSELNATIQKYKMKSEEHDRTIKKLLKTKVDLKKIRKTYQDVLLQRDLNQVVINIQEKTEEQLTQQAKELLDAADESTSHVAALHNKIDRKQTIEDYNVKHSDDFRAVFQQKLASMDDVLSKMTTEQTTKLESVNADIGVALNLFNSYFSEFGNLFQKFESKFGQHAQMNVDLTSSNFMKSMEFCNDSYQNIKDLMTYSNDLKKNALTFQEQYHHSLEKFRSNISILNQLIIDIQIQTSSKIKDLENNVKSTSEFHKQQTCSLIQMFNDFFLTQKTFLQINDTKVNNILSNNNAYSEEIYQKLKNFQQVIDAEFASIQMLVKANQKQASETINEVVETQHTAAKRMKTANDEFQSLIDNFNHQNLIKENQLKVSFEDVYKENSNNKKNVKEKCDSIFEGLEIVDKNVADVFILQENVLKEQQQNLSDAGATVSREKETLLKHHSHYLHHIDVFKNDITNEFSKIKSVTEEHKENIVPCFNRMSNVISTASVNIDSTAGLLKDEFKSRNNEIMNFLLQKDVSTGFTPARKEYSYPREFVATSPFEDIIQRHKVHLSASEETAMKLSIDSSFETSPCNSGCRSIRDSKENIIFSINSDSDSLDSCTPQASQTALNSEIRKNENQSSVHKPSRLPRRRSYKKKIKSHSVIQRKPLAPSNHSNK